MPMQQGTQRQGVTGAAIVPPAGTATDDITVLGAAALARRIALGDLSAREVVEAHIARIERVNPALNAVVDARYDIARAEAREADARRARGEALGLLHGVPVTVKEALDVAEMPATFGLPSRAALRATEDDRYVARLRAAGAIVLGKTNAAQLLLFLETDNPLYGRTNNPWDLTRSAGGSSGGEAAIVAAGGSPLGLATDLGGSIRVPATSCGIAGLKPTAGRTPDAGRYSVPIGQRAIVSQVGILARETADVALGLVVLNGGSDPRTEPPMPLGDPGIVDVSRLRVAYYTEDGTFTLAPAVARAVAEAADALRGRGAHVTRWAPPDAGHALDLFLGIMSADGAAGLLATLGVDKRDLRIADIVSAGRSSRRKIDLLVWLLGLLGQRGMARVVRNYGHHDTAHYWALVEAQMAYRRRFAAALDGDDGGPFDVILCPAFALPAMMHGASKDLVTAGAYTPLYNVLGYPTGIVPFTRVRAGEEVGRMPSRDKMEQAARRTEVGSAGLPIGVQVVARPWREHIALAAMQTLEAAARSRDDFPSCPPL